MPWRLLAVLQASHRCTRQGKPTHTCQQHYPAPARLAADARGALSPASRTQILSAIIVLGCSAYVVDILNSWSYYVSLGYWGRRLQGIMPSFDNGLHHGAARHLLADTYSSAIFALTSGLMGFLAGVFLLLMTLKPAWLKASAPRALGITDAVTSGLLAACFLSSGATLSASGVCTSGAYCGNLIAANAFSWLSFLLWSASVALAVAERMRGPRAPSAGAWVHDIAATT